MSVNETREPIDITGAELVEIVIRADGKVVWVNTPGCAVRICRISGAVTIVDQRRKKREKP